MIVYMLDIYIHAGLCIHYASLGVRSLSRVRACSQRKKMHGLKIFLSRGPRIPRRSQCVLSLVFLYDRDRAIHIPIFLTLTTRVPHTQRSFQPTLGIVESLMVRQSLPSGSQCMYVDKCIQGEHPFALGWLASFPFVCSK